jgi:hypothetical protein
MDGTGLIAQVGLLAQSTFKLRYFWATLGLVVALLAGALILHLFDRWRKRAGTEGLSAGDQLSHFRELHEQGTITREEFERIRTRLAGELRKEMDMGPPPQPPPPATSQPAPEELTLPQPPSEDIRPQ